MQLEEDACSSAVRGIELAREERGEALRRVAELQAYTYMCMHMYMYVYVCVCVAELQATAETLALNPGPSLLTPYP